VNGREFQERLLRRAKRAGVTVSADLGGRLEIYYRLLATWNQKINLSGLDLTEPRPEALDRLLIEPLVAAKHAPPGVGRRLIDVGSGGGSPAIPFSLALPGSQILLVEAKTRKSVFLREALRALEITTAEVATARFEELLTKPNLHEAHDILTIRAVRVEGRVLMGLQAFVKPGGHLFLFRAAGSDPPGALPPPLLWQATFPLIESLQSHLVVVTKRSGRR
jgi:16S rRNA (guanine527-N7)-methyltransferase